MVQRLLAARDDTVSVRTVERAVADIRQAQRASALATVRVETPPGDQLQVDFGQKRVLIAGVRVRIFLLVAVLSYSRRLFVKPFLNERGPDWREGIAAAFMHFGGVPPTVLGDNARPLVRARDRATGTVIFHPAYLAFCRDWDVQPRACAPYRARTKGKTEAGVKYVKRNALADQAFASFTALEPHLGAWMTIDTVRYSVPHRLVRDQVDVVLDEQTVTIFHGLTVVATHADRASPSRVWSTRLTMKACGVGRPSTPSRRQPPPSRSSGATWLSMRPSSPAVSDERHRACACHRAAHAAPAPVRRRSSGCRPQRRRARRADLSRFPRRSAPHESTSSATCRLNGGAPISSFSWSPDATSAAAC